MGAEIAITWYSTFVCLQRESKIHRYWQVVSIVSKVAANIDAAYCRDDCRAWKTDDDPPDRPANSRYFFRQTRCVDPLSTGFCQPQQLSDITSGPGTPWPGSSDVVRQYTCSSLTKRPSLTTVFLWRILSKYRRSSILLQLRFRVVSRLIRLAIVVCL